MKLLPVIGMCSFLFALSPMHAVVGQIYSGQEKIEVTTLPLYRILIVVQDSVQKMHNDFPVNDVLTGSCETVKQSLVLLTSCVDAINNNVLYEYGDVRDRFKAMVLCVGDFGAMPEPYILREFRRVIEEFDAYLTTFVVSRAAFLSPKAKNTFESMTSLNQLLLKNVLNDEHFSWDFLDYLDDYFVSRPFEFVQEHPALISSVVLVVIASVIYYSYWEKAPFNINDKKGESILLAQDLKKKKSTQEIREEIKPIFEEMNRKITEEKNAYVSKKRFNDIITKMQSPEGAKDVSDSLFEDLEHQ